VTWPRVLLITSEWPSPAALKRQAGALKGAGIAVEIFAFRGGRNPYNYAAAWTQLRPRLHPGHYDVVHAQFAQSLLLALPKRVPLVVTLGSGDLEAPSTPLQRILHLAARAAGRRADAVIVCSEELRQLVRTRAPVHVIPPDIDEEALTARLLDVYRSVLPSPS
jgi:hypothetical protein